MANSYIQTLCFILSFTSFVLTTTAANHTKLALRLIHRDSILYPFHNISANNVIKTDDLRAPLSPEPKMISFLVNISIGEPPVPQLLAMDTGSPLTWICTVCSPESNPLYDITKSSTYKRIPCFYPYECNSYADHVECGIDKQCSYQIRYVDKSSSQGIIASDKFTFVTSSEGIAELDDVMIGVGLDNRGIVNDLSGILGLERLNQYSLVARVGNKFSYCLGNISDPYYMYNQLILGEGAIFEGYSTPMKFKDHHYVVKLDGITVGQKQLSIDQQEFDFNVVIDTGTTLTYLRRSGFDALKAEVEMLMDGLMQPAVVINSGERPCYQGNLVRDLKGFPVVSLNLAGGTDLTFGVEGLFRRVNDNVFCMAVDVSTDDWSIIGIYAMQYYNFGFDLDAMKVSFQSIDCQLLEE